MRLGGERTNFCRELDDALVCPDDLLAHEQLLDGDLRLDILRKLVQRVNGPILTMQGDHDVIRSAKVKVSKRDEIRVDGRVHPVTASTNCDG